MDYMRETDIEKLVNSEDWGDRHSIAVSLRVPKKYLTKLSKDENVSVRCAVATNPNTLKEDIINMFEDKNWRVRELAKDELARRRKLEEVLP